ncbi:MAG: tRNA (N6-isopentenyl adenosine(37)-C2)-methylthiotransferase MiaB [bacterium]|nr:tRNA (N6-isopentenyl adenosine(37)-C2)-methylthiotransferase MiaB [bacterium]
MSIPKTKTAYLETYGCQMNEYDSELVKTILTKAGYEFVLSPNTADVVMLNTCSVRDNANRKVYNRVHTLRQSRTTEAPFKVGILGCMATNIRKDLLEDRSLKIDFIAGPDSYKKLPDLISTGFESGEKTFNLTLSEFETYSDVYPTREGGVNAWIAIMRGCNNYCTFCVVPHTRGRERSREPESVVDEVKRLVDEGFTQVTLLGQNVNSYHANDTDFAGLLEKVSDVPGIKRIRYTSPHPKDFPRHLLQLMADRDNICNQIHMPLQAGNNRVLEMMNRTYTKEEFYDLVAEARETIPNLKMTTDIIVGFPTETDAEFEETFEVMERVEFDSAYIFKYSERKNTLAARKFPDDVPEAMKTERIVRLNDLQKIVSLKRNQAQIGEVQDILIESLSTKRDTNMATGRNAGNVLVLVPNEGRRVGEYTNATITEATPNVLRGIVS